MEKVESVQLGPQSVRSIALGNDISSSRETRERKEEKSKRLIKIS